MAGEITPKDLVPDVLEVLRHHRGEWLSPVDIWSYIQQTDADLTGRIKGRVSKYKNPSRNNEIWFVANTFTYVRRFPNFEVANVDTIPAKKTPGGWMVARAMPEGPVDVRELFASGIPG